MEPFLNLLGQLAPSAIPGALLAGGVWAMMVGKIRPQSELEYRETLADKAAESSERWRSLYFDEKDRGDKLLGIVSDIVGEETATTRLIEAMREKVGDPSPPGRTS